MAQLKTKKPYVPPTLRMMRLAFSVLGPVFPKLMGSWAYNLWFTTVRFKTPPHEIDANNTARRSILEVDGVPVSIFTWGDGPLILFIHGWSGRGTQVAPFLDGLLSAGYGVISFDGPAHGETPGNKTNILEMSKVVLAINRKYGPFQAAITHSFAGMIIAYVMDQGLQLQKVVSISPPDNMDTVADIIRRSLTIPDRAMQVMHDKTVYFFGSEFSEKMSTINNVKNLNTKALIIHDENDEDVPWQSGQAIADAYKSAKFIRTRGLGHRRIIRDPDVVNATIEFITQ